MISAEQSDYLERIAWEATKGIVGADVAERNGELHDAIVSGLSDIVQDAHEQGLRAAMVQLSILPDAAHVVG